MPGAHKGLYCGLGIDFRVKTVYSEFKFELRMGQWM